MNHMKLLEPEGKAMHDAFHKVHPSVTIDMHEFGGAGSIIYNFISNICIFTS